MIEMKANENFNHEESTKSPKMEDKSFKNMLNMISLRQKIIFVVCVTVILLLLILVIVMICSQSTVTFKYVYGSVIDAGTTGTRVYLYSWPSGVENEEYQLNELVKCKCEAINVINLTISDNCLENCLKQIKSNISSEFKPKVNIYLAATAGMRIVSKEDPNFASTQFDRASKIMENAGFNVKQSGLISGQEEGASSWITVNILKHILKGKDVSAASTYGMMEMGGGSMQIVYYDDKVTSNNYVVTVFGKKYPLYSRSYLCYGTNALYLKYLSFVSTQVDEHEYNCLLVHTPLNIDLKHTYCQYNQSNIITKPNLFKPIRNTKLCLSQIKKFVAIEQNVMGKNIIALSAYYYFYDFLRRSYAFKYGDSIAEKTNEFCNEDYNNLATKFPRDKKYADKYCLIGNFITEVFAQNSLTPANNYGGLTFMRKLENKSVEWTYGYMLQKSIECDISSFTTIPMSVYLSVIIISILVIVALVVGIFCYIFVTIARRGKSDFDA